MANTPPNPFPASTVAAQAYDVLTPEGPQARILRTYAAIASGYHGYKRNGDGGGSAVIGGLAGLLLPVVTIPVAVFQGFATPKT